jgi:hypothetical protein
VTAGDDRVPGAGEGPAATPSTAAQPDPAEELDGMTGVMLGEAEQTLGTGAPWPVGGGPETEVDDE